MNKSRHASRCALILVTAVTSTSYVAKSVHVHVATGQLKKAQVSNESMKIVRIQVNIECVG